MAGTFSQIYIQYVFAVKGRENLLQKPWRDEVFKYIAGIIKEKNQKAIVVNGVADHVHVFVGIKPFMNISDLVRDIKNNSSKFINEQKFLKGKFSWQEGYGLFRMLIHRLTMSINIYSIAAANRQEEHHQKKTFKKEYLDFLQKFEIEYNEKYLFEWLD